jgi:hypothetical protein
MEGNTQRSIAFIGDVTFGVAFDSVDAIEFSYRTTQAHFIYVTTELPESVVDVDRVQRILPIAE